MVKLRFLAITRKELYSWFISPAVYVITIFFLVFIAVWFYYLQRFFAMDTAALRPFFSAFPVAYIPVIPVLTMKAWAEERKLGSDEILFSLPFTESELVFGKFLTCMTILVAMLILTIPVPLTLLPLGYFDPGVIMGEYLGALLLGACATAIGLSLSVISKNQAASFLGASSVLIVMTFGSWFSSGLPPMLAGFINYISLSFHFESFSRGLLDSRDIAFFILVTGLFLFLNTQVLLFRKWSN